MKTEELMVVQYTPNYRTPIELRLRCIRLDKWQATLKHYKMPFLTRPAIYPTTSIMHYNLSSMGMSAD